MELKKTKLALALLPLILSSCGTAPSIFGVYSFVMGRTDGAHFGVYMVMSDTAVENSPIVAPAADPETEEPTRYHFFFTYENVASPTGDEPVANYVNYEEDPTDDDEEFFDHYVEGYYTYNSQDGAISLNIQKLTENGEVIDLEALFVELGLTQAQIEQFYKTFIQVKWPGGDTIDLTIPVSMEDAIKEILQDIQTSTYHTLTISLKREVY